MLLRYTGNRRQYFTKLKVRLHNHSKLLCTSASTNTAIPFAATAADIVTGTPPKEARVVICGGGIMGSAVAYHLALLGWGPHTVVIEQSK